MINLKKNQVVAIGLSGGVDSSVAALILKEMGYEVIALFVQNWESEENSFCTAEQDLSDAKVVADYINIPLQVINFSREYWNNVFQYCLDEFIQGRTPNPDVLCNKEIKFKSLLMYAKTLGATYLATGHYARIQNQNSYYQLLKSNDSNKDQSYFLHLLNQYQLANSIFPIGNYQKSEIRAIAKNAGLINHDKKDSTGICFIGERNFKDFLNEFLLAQPGNIETPEGKILGQHDGIMFYTLGQRKGLQIGGSKDYLKKAPWYVINKDVQRNVLIVVQGHDHPLLYSEELICTNLHWIREVEPLFPLTCKAKTRYRQTDQICTVIQVDNNCCRVQFKCPQRAITCGQSVVFYLENECLGGGIIIANNRTHFT